MSTHEDASWQPSSEMVIYVTGWIQAAPKCKWCYLKELGVFFGEEKNYLELARWVPYLLFLKDFWVMTAQIRSKSAVVLTDSPGERDQQLFPFTLSGTGTVWTARGHWSFPKAKFQVCPFFSICNAVHAPLLNTNHQHMTEEPRTHSPEPKLSPILPGCSMLYLVLQVMVSESSDPANMDGWMDTLEAHQ